MAKARGLLAEQLMKYADLLVHRKQGDLKIMLTALEEYFKGVPRVEMPKGRVGELLRHVMNYDNKVERLSKEELALLWRSVDFLLGEVAGIDVGNLLQEEVVIKNPHAVHEGNYWLLPRCGFIPCISHEAFARQFSRYFIDALGLDAWEVMRVLHSNGGSMCALLLRNGAIRCTITKAKRVDGTLQRGSGYYQCCQRSLPWLKAKIESMPTDKSMVWVYDPAKEYTGPQAGIAFALKKKRKADGTS